MKPLPFPFDILIDLPAGLIAGLGSVAVGLGALAVALLIGVRCYEWLTDLWSPDARPEGAVKLGAAAIGGVAGIYVAMVLYRAMFALAFSLLHTID